MKKLLAVLVLSFACQAQQTATPPAAHWWALTTALAGDDMQGRDTGSEAYERAAKLVADHFRQAGLKPAGDNGTFFQRILMHQVALDTVHSSVILHSPGESPLRLLEEVTLAPREGLPSDLAGPLVFTGYGVLTPELKPKLRGSIAVFFNNTPATLSSAEREAFTRERVHVLGEAGALAVVSIDNPAAIEPFHWPAAYARTVTLNTPAPGKAPVTLRISAEAAAKLFAPSDRWPEMLKAAEGGADLPARPLAASLALHLVTESREISSPNILAILPGTEKPSDYVALSAHLDGYGFGSPVLGDNLYNGALDDAAYVATLLEMADTLAHHPPKRSLLFCIFTGEEKGLLGSQFFTQHPTVPVAAIVADLNLDQLRPIFPLKILTMEGLTDSSIGDTAQAVAATYSIELRTDREPERNLFRRADNYNFVRIGVPIGSFIFGYNPGTAEERTYRDWYARRYHKPQDDLSTPIDWAAAVTFNHFFRDLALALANAPNPPRWTQASPYAPK